MRHSRLTVHRLWPSLPSSNAKKKKKKKKKTRKTEKKEDRPRARALLNVPAPASYLPYVETIVDRNRRLYFVRVNVRWRQYVSTTGSYDVPVTRHSDARASIVSPYSPCSYRARFKSLVDKFDVRLLRMKSRILQTSLVRLRTRCLAS